MPKLPSRCRDIALRHNCDACGNEIGACTNLAPPLFVDRSRADQLSLDTHNQPV